MVDPRQPDEGLSAPLIRSARVRPARLVSATPSPTYPPAQPIPVSGSSPTDRLPVAVARPSGPPQWCVISAPVEDREQVDQRRGRRCAAVDPVAVVREQDRRAQVVRGAAAPEGEPVVGGPLAVDDEVPRRR